MAKTKTNPKEQFQQKDFYVAWEDKNNAQREASLNSYTASIIMKTNKTAREENKPELAFWNKNASAEELANSTPYNAVTGQPYSNVSDVVLRCVQKLNGYKEPTFLTMHEANLLGGKLKKQLDENGKEMKTERNGKTAYVQGVKIPYLKKGEWHTKLDADGKPIQTQAKDKNGKLKFDEKGQAIMRDVKEFVPYQAPMIETIQLYHTSQFVGLDESKLKSRDLTKFNKKAEYFKENPQALTKPERITSLGLNANIAQNLHNFVKAVKSGQDYTRTNTQQIDRSAKKEFNLQR